MKSRFLDCCCIFAAVVTLWLTFHFTGSLVFKYLVFTAVLFFLKPNIKEEIKKEFKLKDTVISALVFLAVSTVLSLIFPLSDSKTTYTVFELFSAVLLAPLYEELFCRKILTRNMNTFSGAFFSSFVFASLHSFDVFLYAFFSGLVLYAIYKKTGTVKTSITVHMLSNILAVVSRLI